MNPLFMHLQMAIAADGGHSTVKPGPVTPVHQRGASRDFAEIVSSDIYEHMRTQPKLIAAMDNLVASTAPQASRVKAALPLVTKAARSLYDAAASGDVKFEAIFPESVLVGIAKHLLVPAV